MTKNKWICILLILAAGLGGCNLDNWHYFVKRDCKIIVEGTPPTDPPPDPPIGYEDGRPVAFQLTADYPSGALSADEILTDGRAYDEQGIWKVGTYSLNIRKRGYETIDGSFTMPRKGFGVHTVERMMICKKRKIIFDITDATTGTKIKPDKVLIGALPIQDGSMVKPGDYTLEISKSGYQSIVEGEFSLGVGEQAYYLRRSMNTGKVELKFLFTDSRTRKPIAADRILINKKQVAKDNTFVNPGNYKLSVFKQGYKPVQNLSIDVPQTSVHTVERALVKSVIRFYWQVYSDYPRNWELDPVDRVLVDGKAIEKGNYISPGKHHIEIRQAAHEVFHKDFVVPTNIKEYNFKATLKSLPRLLEFYIKHDIAAPKDLASPKLSITHLEKGKRYDVKGSIKVKPGTYRVDVSQEAYHDASDEKKIWPATYTEKIDIMLKAKERVVNVEVSFDILPPANLDSHVVSFADPQTGTRRVVRPGGAIRPGKYSYVVEKAGYLMVGGKKAANIIPSEKPYNIKAEMTAQPRRLVFSMIHEGVLQEAEQITVNGKPLSTEPYKPGTYEIQAKFKKFSPVSKKINLVPGVGPFTVSLPLSPK